MVSQALVSGKKNIYLDTIPVGGMYHVVGWYVSYLIHVGIILFYVA